MMHRGTTSCVPADAWHTTCSGKVTIDRMADRAFQRGGSPWRWADFWRWLCNGEASLYIGDHLIAGMWWTGSEGAEIAFVAGDWSNDEADMLFRWANRDAAKRGFGRIEYNGRASWPRFLRMKGARQ